MSEGSAGRPAASGPPRPGTVRLALLVDGVGALVSAVFLGVLLPAYQDWIGMPSPILHALAGIAGLFAVNAFLAYRLGGQRAGEWLKAIATANLAYCGLTGVLVAACFGQLTGYGVAYFVAEIAIILGLVRFERRAAGARGPAGKGVVTSG